MASYLKSDIKAGGMIVFCLVLLGALIFYIGGIKQFETSYEIRVLTDSAYGVGKSSVVTYSGVKVGEVKSIRILPEKEIKAELKRLANPTYTEDDVRVEMILSVLSSVILRSDSRAQVVGSGLVGDQTVNLTPGSFTLPVVPHGTTLVGISLTGFGKLQKGIGKIDFDNLVLNARKIIMNLSEASERVRSAMDKVDQLLVDIDRTSQISNILNKTEKLVDDLDSVLVENSANFQNAVSNFNQLSEDLKTEVKPMLTSLRSASQSADEMLTQNKDEVDAFVSDLKTTAANFNQFSLKIKKYPWTILRKTKVNPEDADLFPDTSEIQFSKPPSEKKRKPFFIF